MTQKKTNQCNCGREFPIETKEQQVTFNDHARDCDGTVWSGQAHVKFFLGEEDGLLYYEVEADGADFIGEGRVVPSSTASEWRQWLAQRVRNDSRPSGVPIDPADESLAKKLEAGQ